MFIGGCELFARVFFTLVDACLGDDEVLFTVLVEVTSPDDVVGTVEDFVHLFFGETLDCGVVVGDVESHYKLTEPVVFVELVHHLVDKVLLDFYFSQLIHGLDEDDPCEVGLLVELTVLFLGDNLLFYVVTRRLQLGVFVVQLLDSWLEFSTIWSSILRSLTFSCTFSKCWTMRRSLKPSARLRR